MKSFKQKTAYEIVRRDWSSDVCSSDLPERFHAKITAIEESKDIEKIPLTELVEIGRASCRERVFALV